MWKIGDSSIHLIMFSVLTVIYWTRSTWTWQPQKMLPITTIWPSFPIKSTLDDQNNDKRVESLKWSLLGKCGRRWRINQRLPPLASLLPLCRYITSIDSTRHSGTYYIWLLGSIVLLLARKQHFLVTRNWFPFFFSTSFCLCGGVGCHHAEKFRS